jgi:hypothetical protein
MKFVVINHCLWILFASSGIGGKSSEISLIGPFLKVLRSSVTTILGIGERKRGIIKRKGQQKSSKKEK